MSAPKWNGMIYGLKVTLTCPDCGADCPLENPFGNARPIDENISEGIRTAWVRHRITGCRK